jgi:iron complex outermembrane receptor protein
MKKHIGEKSVLQLPTGSRNTSLSLLMFLLISAASFPSAGQVTVTDKDSVTVATDRITDPARSHCISGTTIITSGDFNKGLILNAEGLVAGRIPGLVMRLTDGSPSATYELASMRYASFYSPLSPLVVVDGVPLTGMPLMLNPRDIETISYLNNGPSAEYGSLARNGALVIDTKKGRQGLHFSYNGQTALSYGKKYGNLTGDQVRAELFERYSDDPELLDLAGVANTDWQDEIYRTAFSQDHHLSVSGTAASVPFRLSAGQTLAQGTILSTIYSKTTFSGSLTPSLLDNHLKIALSGYGTIGKDQSVNSDVPHFAVFADPTTPVFLNNDPSAGYTSGNLFINPVAMIDLSDNNRELSQLHGILSADYSMHFMPELSLGFKLALARHTVNTEEIIRPGGGYYPLHERNGMKNEEFSSRSLDFHTGYRAPLERIKGDLELKAGYYMHYLGTDTKELITGYVDPSLIYTNSHSTSENYRSSAYGSVSLSSSERYNISAMIRNDSFSEFTEANRSTLSYSLSTEWNITGEPFFPDGSVIDYLGLNLSVGSSGTNPGLNLTNVMINPFLKSETGSFLIAGVSLSVLDRLLDVSVNAFLNRSRDMLAVVPISFGQSMLVNTGESDSRGLEFRADASLIDKRELKWYASMHFTACDNKTRSLGPGIEFITYGNITYPFGDIMIQETGWPANTFYLLKQVYDDNGMPVQGLYADTDNDGYFGWDDRYHGKSADPEFAAGIWSSINYRDWELSLSASSRAGNYVYNIESLYGSYGYMTSGGILRNIPSLVYDSEFTALSYYSDYHIDNGSFVRLDFVSAGRTLRNVAGKDIDIRLSATLQNVFTLTAYRGLDPDVEAGNYGFTWPRPRIASLGIGIDF